MEGGLLTRKPPKIALLSMGFVVVEPNSPWKLLENLLFSPYKSLFFEVERAWEPCVSYVYTFLSYFLANVANSDVSKDYLVEGKADEIFRKNLLELQAIYDGYIPALTCNIICHHIYLRSPIGYYLMIK